MENEALHYTYKTYKRRWYILGLYSLVSFSQSLIYGTWGPISISAEKAFKFDQVDFALLPNWYNVGYFIALFPYMWLIQEKGLRMAVLITAGLCAAAAGFRCLSFGTLASDRLFIHIGQALNGLASPVTWFAATDLSEAWFPPHERAIATSVSLSLGSVGAAVSFLAPMFVDSYHPEDDEETRMAIRHLLYLEYLFSAVVLVLIIIYFPAHPPVPPSYTATVKRFPLCKGLKQLMTVSQAWVMLSVYAISTSVYASWDQVLTNFVSPAMDEVEAGWLGLVNDIVSIIACPALSVTAIYWQETHAKLVCVIFMIVGCISLGILTLTSVFFKTWFTRATIWATLTVSSVALSAPQGIWWELSCEASYPIAEATVSGLATLGSCIGSWIFFFLYMFPSLGTQWPTWTLLVSEIVCIPVLLVYRPSMKRSEDDKRGMASSEQQPESERIGETAM